MKFEDFMGKIYSEAIKPAVKGYFRNYLITLPLTVGALSGLVAYEILDNRIDPRFPEKELWEYSLSAIAGLAMTGITNRALKRLIK